ncbi:MAG: hypothetical protein FWG43_00275 [Clostridiales bacterium]|nr:hypothetical protein [Clostridiales bacterium]
MDINAWIRQKKTASITLGELENFLRSPVYSEFVIEINALIDRGLIRPMGKEKNGMLPPLFRRYRICRKEEDQKSAQAEILRLGPAFNPSGYLSNIHLYNKQRELLLSLHDYAQNNAAELMLYMSKNERAYAIWGNEKQLDDSLCQSMLRYTGWESKLNYYQTPEPFWDYLCNGAATKSILILENKDIWFSLRKLLMERKSAFQLYGQLFDGILYGEGKKIARSDALADYGSQGFQACPSFYYWGDLDYEGIGIYLMISTFPTRLFVPGYLAMLDYAQRQNLTLCKTAQTAPSQLDEFLNCFDKESAMEIKELLAAGKYIPQEICNYPRLMAALQPKLQVESEVNEE